MHASCNSPVMQLSHVKRSKKYSGNCWFISLGNLQDAFEHPVDAFTHLHIAPRSRQQGKCCSPLSWFPGQGSTCHQVQEGGSHTSAYTVVTRAHMMYCNCPSASTHTTGHVHLKMAEWGITIKVFTKKCASCNSPVIYNIADKRSINTQAIVEL